MAEQHHTKEEIRRTVDAACAQLADRGKLIEGGFAAMLAHGPWKDHIKTVGDLRLLRLAYLAGAQHLWGSINAVLDPGEEASQRDMERMNRLDEEMRAAADELQLFVGKPGGVA